MTTDLIVTLPHERPPMPTTLVDRKVAARIDRRQTGRRADIALGGACPHCGHDRPASHHLRDAGDATPELATELGYCPVLAAKRNGPR